jgi:phosphoribosylaminoimidazolecarboxamide formyltransferase/IMP cyclohydrolase
MKPISRALMSVTDKSGLAEFATFLAGYQIEILSTGALPSSCGTTASRGRSRTSPVSGDVDGRVKTLHPKVHGGLLGRRDLVSHQEQMAAHGIVPIDLVVVNLYQFEKAVAKPGCTLEDAIENIDIGGPTMLRAAAKNYQAVTVVVDPADYPRLMAEMKHNKGATNLGTRFTLARKVFSWTHEYDGAIYRYLAERPRPAEWAYPHHHHEPGPQDRPERPPVLPGPAHRHCHGNPGTDSELEKLDLLPGRTLRPGGEHHRSACSTSSDYMGQCGLG